MTSVQSRFPRRWQIGPVVVDTASLQIRHADQIITSEATQVGTLIALIDAWPEIVDKNSLIDRVWGSPVVSEAAVHKTISLLRKTLSEAGAGDCIETRHRIGYRLAVEPCLLEASDSRAWSATTRPSSSRGNLPWLTGAAVLGVLAAAGMLFSILFDSSDTGSPLPVAEAINPSNEASINPALEGLDVPALLELARRSTPDDLDTAEQALVVAAQAINEAGEPHQLEGLVVKQRGLVRYFQGRFQLAIDDWQNALERLEADGNQVEVANVLSNLGAAHDELDRPDAEVAAYFQRALEQWQALNDLEGQARTLNNRIGLWTRREQLARARQDIDALKVIADELGDSAWLARVALHQGDWATRVPPNDPLPWFEQAYDHARQAGDLSTAAISAQRVARTLGGRGLLEDEMEWLQRARRHLEAAGLASRLPILDFAMAVNRERLGNPAMARSHYHSVINGLEDGQSIHLRIDAEVGLARLDLNDGRTREAEQLLGNALQLARVYNHPEAEASVLIARGFLVLMEEDGAVAAIEAVKAARERLGDIMPWSFEQNLLALEAKAMIADRRHGEAESLIRVLRDKAMSRSDAQSIQQADFLDAMRLFAQGQFNLAYQKHRRAQGQSLIPALGDDQAGTLIARPSNHPDRSARWVWLPWLLVPLAFGAGWFNRRSGRER